MTASAATLPVWQAALLVAAGGALGGAARHALTRFVDARRAGELPWGTLLVNVSGAWLAGLVAGSDSGGGEALRVLLLVGVLGAFTTVSALGLQVLQLVRSERAGSALRYVALTLLLGLAAVSLGYAAGAAGAG